jgi:hypothetical protein
MAAAAGAEATVIDGAGGTVTRPGVLSAGGSGPTRGARGTVSSGSLTVTGKSLGSGCAATGFGAGVSIGVTAAVSDVKTAAGGGKGSGRSGCVLTGSDGTFRAVAGASALAVSAAGTGERDTIIQPTRNISAIAAAATSCAAGKRRLLVLAVCTCRGGEGDSLCSSAPSAGRPGSRAFASDKHLRASSRHPASAAASARRTSRSARLRRIRSSKLCHSPLVVWDTITFTGCKTRTRPGRKVYGFDNAVPGEGPANSGSVSLLRSTHRP